ncbi:hypothetical protein [Marinagarivorans cellulosilyticus]|uniref:Uncharacterized protein n=1 Tax=Marinagarivorans cellulosilyticus TaxID=2721545 RepID=A0AAN1WKX9_9GAMM|nr:hypothetical protein [Marinagarivorans cellulosilyticus]BCD99502.1 hypothetical protein MARGE09_P3704 [Marinagarivorans cellulosilyticus]
MFELQDSKGNRFALSRGAPKTSKSLIHAGSPLQVKRLLRHCDTVTLLRAYSHFFAGQKASIKPLAPKASDSNNDQTLVFETRIFDNNTSGLPTAQRASAQRFSREQQLFEAIANGELQLEQTYIAQAFDIAKAEKALNLSRSRLLSELNAIAINERAAAKKSNNAKQPIAQWGASSQHAASQNTPKALTIGQHYRRFIASLPQVIKADGAGIVSAPTGNSEIQSKEIIKALGFSTTKVSTGQLQHALQLMSAIWRDKGLYKTLSQFSNTYATAHEPNAGAQPSGTPKGSATAVSEVTHFELALTLLLSHNQEPHALSSPSARQIELFPRFKQAGRNLWETADASRTIAAERQTTAGSASYSDLVAEEAPARERNTPLTFIEIQLLDDKGEPVAGEAYWIRDTEGNEHTGSTDGSGKARVDSIKSGNCLVAFPDIDGSGIQQCRAGDDCCTPAEDDCASQGTESDETESTTEQTTASATQESDEENNTSASTNTNDQPPNPVAGTSEQPKESVELCCLEANGDPASELPYKATFSDGSISSGKLSKTGTAELTEKPAGEVTVIYGEESSDTEITQLRTEVKSVLEQILVNERKETKDIEARLQEMGIIERYWEYKKAEFRGVANFTVGLATFVKEVSDFSPLQMFNKAVGSAWDAWQNTNNQNYLEAFSKSFTDKQFKDLADVIGIDPRTITKQDLAQAQAFANFIWDDAETRSVLMSFAKDFALAQHSIEVTEFGSEMAMELVFDVLITALTLGAGATVVAASKLKHLDKLKGLGKLFKELAETLRKKASFKKAKGKVGNTIQTQLDKPETLKGSVSPRREVEIPPEAPRSPQRKSRDIIETLNEADKEKIRNVSTFKPQGISKASALEHLKTDSGKEMIKSLKAADPSADDAVILDRAIGLLKTGSTPPKSILINSPLYKLVPEGTNVTPYSPFFTTKSEIYKAKASGRTISDYFGLPASSDAAKYDIFVMKPKKSNIKAFESDIAPTSELGGAITTEGGGVQVLVTNRSEFGSPIKIGQLEDN